MDPLLKDLSGRKQSFRRTISSLAAELKDVRARLASCQQFSAQEMETRQEIEIKARSMEEKIIQLQKDLDQTNAQLHASAFTIDKYVKELDDLRSLLSATRETADANATLAHSARIKCLALLKVLHEKDTSIKEHEQHVHRLGMQLNLLHADLQSREDTQKYSIDKCYMLEQGTTQEPVKATRSKTFELGKILEEVSPKSLEKINMILTEKDEEIARLREGIRILSSHWELKTMEMESQLEKHQGNDRELKTMVMKLEICLQEAHSQIRKLRRMGERKDKVLKELRDELVTKRQHGCAGNGFWETSGFKILLSISLLILVLFSKR